MTNAWTLMTALPPTKGHLSLIEWGALLPVKKMYVVVATQPNEPFARERYHALRSAFSDDHRVEVIWFHREIPQDPDSEGFWEFWWNTMRTGDHGRFFANMEPGDFFVSSEAYGAKLAEGTEAIFMPYDPNRELVPTKATNVRNDMLRNFADIAPSFQHCLRSTITIFGAESTGKTTLSKEVSGLLDAHWLFEWARPYLETVGPEITIPKMEAIWHGQAATQAHGWDFYDKPYMIQDTDLFSTVGYWEQPHWEDTLGPVPEGLIKDAHTLKSDLYIITRSNIPFEQDEIRYGVDRRESPDSYWIGLAEKYNLPYVVLNTSDLHERRAEAMAQVRRVGKAKAATINYERQFN